MFNTIAQKDTGLRGDSRSHQRDSKKTGMSKTLQKCNSALSHASGTINTCRNTHSSLATFAHQTSALPVQSYASTSSLKSFDKAKAISGSKVSNAHHNTNSGSTFNIARKSGDSIRLNQNNIASNGARVKINTDGHSKSQASLLAVSGS